MSRYNIANTDAPEFLSQFKRPECFSERDWLPWLHQHYQSAFGAELKALQRGTPPNHCEDCESGSSHRLFAQLRGTCFPIAIAQTETTE